MLALSGCGGGGDASAVPEIPTIEPAEMETLLAESDKPVVLNVWASWCIPCRSEAPLLRSANDQFGDQVRFVGLDVRDSQTNAREFIDEFGLTEFDHFFDRSGEVSTALGGRGVPLTFFYREGGEQFVVHFGVIDERTLALNIDELLRSR